MIAFCKSGSVGRTARIFLAADLFGSNKNASIPDFATFSAPWIFTDFISDNILSKRFAVTFLFISIDVNKTLKTYLCIIRYESGVTMIELLEEQMVVSILILFGVRL